MCCGKNRNNAPVQLSQTVVVTQVPPPVNADEVKRLHEIRTQENQSNYNRVTANKSRRR